MVLTLDPGAKLSDYIHKVWQTEDGLLDNCIFAVTQTRDGYIWFGTQQGLVRFDGYRFYTFNSSNTREIKNNYVRTLLEDHKGNLWIGGSGSGLIRYKNEKFKAYTTKDGLSSNNVRSILEYRKGNLWIGTREDKKVPHRKILHRGCLQENMLGMAILGNFVKDKITLKN